MSRCSASVSSPRDVSRWAITERSAGSPSVVEYCKTRPAESSAKTAANASRRPTTSNSSGAGRLPANDTTPGRSVNARMSRTGELDTRPRRPTVEMASHEAWINDPVAYHRNAVSRFRPRDRVPGSGDGVLTHLQLQPASGRALFRSAHDPAAVVEIEGSPLKEEVPAKVGVAASSSWTPMSASDVA
jgi:hypothetical protein